MWVWRQIIWAFIFRRAYQRNIFLAFRRRNLFRLRSAYCEQWLPCTQSTSLVPTNVDRHRLSFALCRWWKCGGFFFRSWPRTPESFTLPPDKSGLRCIISFRSWWQRGRWTTEVFCATVLDYEVLTGVGGEFEHGGRRQTDCLGQISQAGWILIFF